MIAKGVELKVERHGNIAVLSMANPPVNSLSATLRGSLLYAIRQANDDPAVKAIVLQGDGLMFSGGADIREFEQEALVKPHLNEVNMAIELGDKPVVAAIHRCALGGGLELAMACDARIAAQDTQMGLPEITLGLIPGAGGTQRLPRLVGLAHALPAIITGQMWSAEMALQRGLIDRIAQSKDTLFQEALMLAHGLASGQVKGRVASLLSIDHCEAEFDAANNLVEQRLRNQPAAQRAVDCIRKSASDAPFSEGLAFEHQAFMELMSTPESLALRHVFFAERAAARSRLVEEPLPIRIVGIIGAGTMGSGIALCFIANGFQVTVADISEPALEKMRRSIEQTLDTQVQKRRLSQEQKEIQLDLLSTAKSLQGIGACDLIIEAVVEDQKLKEDVLAELAKYCKPSAIIATNTSTLDVNKLAQATGRPDRFLGLHFFSPAHVMKLLEVVRGTHTDPQIIQTALVLAKKIKKTAVVSGVCYGFIGNRMLEGYLRETDRLLLEGCTPAQIDNAMEEFGMAMGPCRMMDLAGVDVNAHVLKQRMLGGFSHNDRAYRSVCLALASRLRYGQKAGKGYYLYEGRTNQSDPEVLELIERLADTHGIKRRGNISKQEIVERCIIPLINEGFAILDEGIAAQSSDIDVVWTAGYGFPKYRGGPMYYAAGIGLEHLRERVRYYADRYSIFPEDWNMADSLRRFSGAEGLTNIENSRSV